MNTWNVDYQDKNGEVRKVSVIYRPSPIQFEDFVPKISAHWAQFLKGLDVARAEQVAVVLENQWQFALATGNEFFKKVSVAIAFKIFDRLDKFFVDNKVAGANEFNTTFVTNILYQPPNEDNVEALADWVPYIATQAANYLLVNRIKPLKIKKVKFHSLFIGPSMEGPVIALRMWEEPNV